jgi:hypothetical protein
MKNLILIMSMFVGLGLTTAFAFDVYDDISNAIKSGNSAVISDYFGNTVDLTILSKEDVYSKTQAQLILKDFFSKNTPKTFSILHKGTSKDGATYAIGSMLTIQGGSFRTYFYIKQVASKNIIQEFRIEKQ